ncbi:MAG: hypothetical protein O2801_10270 [Actinomycetota bacterium]|nr:hypothetical protein [Actinomycetota bacterium]
MWVYWVIAGVITFFIAALTIGREARRLDAVAPRAAYQVNQAVSFVAELLPANTQARLTLDELQQLLVLHLNWLHARGLLPIDVIDRPQHIDAALVITEEALIAHLLGEAEAAGVAVLDDVDVVNVVDAHLAYFDAIGAVGPTASDT